MCIRDSHTAVTSKHTEKDNNFIIKYETLVLFEKTVRTQNVEVKIIKHVHVLCKIAVLLFSVV